MKKQYKNSCLIALFTIVFLGSGCKKYFDEATDNPNLVQNPPLSAELSTVTQKTALNSYRIANFTSYYVQYLASPTAGSATDVYDITNTSAAWNAVYLAMADIYDMKANAIAQGASEYVGVADVLMAYHLSLVTDVWGDAPYSKAFTKETLTPAYDKQEDLYVQIGKLLDEGITELAKTDSKVKLLNTTDLIHKADRAAWIRTAYALKARWLNKISRKSNYDPAAVLAALGNAYTTNGQDANMSTFISLNPWAQIALNNSQLLLDGWLSNQLVNQLNGATYGVSDPRAVKITDRTVNGTFTGTRNGAGNVGGPNTVKDECYISRNSPLTSDKGALTLISYAELKFIEAEAALRLGNTARAYTAYLAGIQAHMDKCGVAATDAAAYIANPAVSVGAGGLTLAQIFKEKYIVTYLNPEAWVDARRFDYAYKGFTLPLNALLPTFIRRVAYPDDERTRNGSNVPAIVPLSTRLWWDQ